MQQINNIKDNFTEDHALDEFEEKLNLLNIEPNINKQLLIVKQMQEIAKNVSALKGWPYNTRVFWDKEAVFWQQRVESKYREFIRNELIANIKSEVNLVLELGTGNTPYIKSAISLDVSREMLTTIDYKNNDNTNNNYNNKRVQANVEHSLPIRDNCVDAIVAVFLCNYIERLDIMLGECKRVLKDNGQIMIVQSAAEVDNYHIIMEKHPAKELTLILRTILQELGFKAQIDVKDVDKKTLVFITATNS